MSVVTEFFSTAKDYLALIPLKYAKPPTPEEIGSFGRAVAETAERYSDRPFITFEGTTVTWGEFNDLANRYAHLYKAQGVSRGDTVSLIMESRIEQVASIAAINKIGATAALINTNLRGRPLIHCVTVTESAKCVIGEELLDALEEVKSELGLKEGQDYIFVKDQGERPAPNWVLDAGELLSEQPSSNPPETLDVDPGETSLYIFTSGTTGLPKAAVLSHRRFVVTARTMSKAAMKLKPTDRIYCCLPLYHGTGLMFGIGAAVASGASIYIRRKFSASRFLDDAREQRTNTFVYIGELCRYLMHTPSKPDDADNPIEKMIGNGLRPDIWKPFKKRFGITRISEFYGASEGNAGFVNLLNKDETIGMTTYSVALVKYDVDADEIIRGEDGYCLPVGLDEPGLMLGEINEKQKFEGYTNAEATEKKVVRNVFKPGDAYFNSGDLIKEIDAGLTFGLPHYQFVDRIGDTFRWKSENVSTNEVGEIINTHQQVKLCNVYGVEVPDADGRAGMATIVLEDGVEQLDLADFSAFVTHELPSYARPVFLRTRTEMDVTGTFKLVKTEARREAYHLDKVPDALFVMRPRSEVYQPLDREIYEAICNGTAGF